VGADGSGGIAAFGPQLSAPPVGRVYGRRRGRRLGGKKSELLDTLFSELSVAVPEPPAQLDPRALFDPRPEAVWIEIGFGGGEHLAAQALAHPNLGFIGCEPFVNGVSSLLGHLDDGGQRNVRIVAEDARVLLQSLPDASIGGAFLLFPDPWPKRRHEERRFLAQGLDQIARVLVDGGTFRIATDHAALGAWMSMAMADHQDFMLEDSARTRPQDWPPTRYESKALAAGRIPFYLTYRRCGRTL